MINKSRLEELSIIIVTWKGDELLRNCLDSLKNAVGEAPEIIVVDNAAEETTRKLVENYSNAKYLPSPGNPGFAGGNNLGLKEATRNYILLLNNDTIIHEDSFSPLIEFLDSHPKVGIVQGTMNIPHFGLDDCGILMWPWGIQRHLHRGESVTCAKLTARRVFAAKGAMLLFRREVVRDTGFLFYDHFKSYFEETDFCKRARNAGWETWFVPTPPIDHLCGKTSAKFPSDEIWQQYIRNILFSFAKNFGFWGRVFTLPAFSIIAFMYKPRVFWKALRGLSSRK